MPTSFNLYFYVVVEMAACKSESGSGIVQLALAKLSPTAPVTVSRLRAAQPLGDTRKSPNISSHSLPYFLNSFTFALALISRFQRLHTEIGTLTRRGTAFSPSVIMSLWRWPCLPILLAWLCFIIGFCLISHKWDSPKSNMISSIFSLAWTLGGLAWAICAAIFTVRAIRNLKEDETAEIGALRPRQ